MRSVDSPHATSLCSRALALLLAGCGTTTTGAEDEGVASASTTTAGDDGWPRPPPPRRLRFARVACHPRHPHGPLNLT